MVMTTWGRIISRFDFSIVDYTVMTGSQASKQGFAGAQRPNELAIRSLYSPRHPDTRGKCCLKLTDLVHCLPLLFTMMPHVTGLDSGLLIGCCCVQAASHGTSGDSHFNQFPTNAANGGESLVRTFFSFYPVIRV